MKHLTLADEIVVLVLDDSTGQINQEFAPLANIAVAAAILMELALQRRIDTDLASLFLVDAASTGDSLLDDVLQEIAAEPQRHPSTWWIDTLSDRHDDLVGRVLARLVAAGILREEERQFLWVFSERAYPKVTGQEEREATARLRAVLFHDDVPEPRDTLLLGLANATGALSQILSEPEQSAVAARIAHIVALEEIGRSVGEIANEVWSAVAIAQGTILH